MKRSTDRILTSHAGSLARPPELLAAYKTAVPRAQLDRTLKSAVGDVVREQADAGVDVVNDGEFGKPMTGDRDYVAWSAYIYGRLSGFEERDMDVKVLFGESESEGGLFRSKDRQDFAQFYKDEGMFPGDGNESLERIRFHMNTGPITYTGQDLVRRDVENFKAAMKAANVEEGFMNCIVPTAGGLMTLTGGDSYYKTADDQAFAMADAMREEYKIITGAGINVQIDDPWLPSMYDSFFCRDSSKDEYLKWAAAQVELVNYALKGIPEEQVRYHMCWGSWHGPHSCDIPLADVAPILIKVNACQYSLEAANVRHAHEYKVWRDVRLPDGKMLMPGAVSHSTNVLEHPEVVADRIVSYANVVGRENVVAGTDCGLGGRVHPQLLWAKLRVLAEGAQLASRTLWGSAN